MSYKLLLSVILLFMSCQYLTAQTVTGKIMDSKGAPLMDAYIYLSGGTKHAHSDELGRYTCSGLDIGDTLLVRYLGFEEGIHIIEEDDYNESLNFTLREDVYLLNQVYVSNSLKDISRVSTIDLETNPVNSSQELLRKVPGLVIGQHAGGGKAEQIFLRGFDIDHGTDLDIQVDGMPVNMVSHAHGQGYSDLHFLIPETVESIDYGKGPYYTEKGNFNTAGYIEFKTKDRLDNSRIGLEVGRFNTTRALGMFDLLGNSEKSSAYIASEFILTDGPFISSQNFNRINILGKYNQQLNNDDNISFLISHFSSKWDASGQIPQRLVDQGVIDRFGSVDDTEGGETSRTNFSLEYMKAINSSSFVQTRFYVSRYDFELYSNFTFFLEDPVFGDQIRQKEDRTIYGLHSTFHKSLNDVRGFDVDLQVGGGFRYDDVNDNELSHTVNRIERLEYKAFGDIDEANLFLFAGAEFSKGQFRIIPGIRFDGFQFGYQDKLALQYENGVVMKAKVSPKLNVMYNPNSHWQLFVKSGIGFHSNDSRVVTSGESDILPSAYGLDVGAIWKPDQRIWLQGTLWYLLSDQEFVYVGDAGIVEPGDKSRRYGIEASLRYQLLSSLYFDADMTYSHARSLAGAENDDFIPLAPDWTASGGLNYRDGNGITGGARFRYLSDRPANESGSIIADGYFVVDLNASYTFNNKITVGFRIDNLFDTEWNEAQFATESRLQNETEPVEEIHFTPGTPFFWRGMVSYAF